MTSDDDMFAGAPLPVKEGGLFHSLLPYTASESDNKKRSAAEAGQGEPEAKRSKEERSNAAGAAPGVSSRFLAQQEGTSIKAASAEDKGSRTSMEDVAVIELDARASGQAEGPRVSFFGIFDGHGGRQVAQHAASNLHSSVMAAGLAAEVAAAASGSRAVSVKSCKAAITAGFKQLDEAILKKSASEGWADGCTAVAVWAVGEVALVANVGDAKCVLARRQAVGSCGGSSSPGTAARQQGQGGGQPVADGGGTQRVASAAVTKQAEQRQVGAGAGAGPAGAEAAAPALEQLKAITLTREHRAIYPQERQRIERAGGFVSGDGRLGGRIEVSRAFGDRAFKKQGMSAAPDIQAFQLSEREAFLLLGCDGFWGVFLPQEAVDFAVKEQAKGYEVKQVCNRLIYEAIREKSCKDNCTVMMVKFG